MCRRKEKRLILHFLSASYFPGSEASARVATAAEGKLYKMTNTAPPFLLFVLAFTSELTSYGMEYPLVILGQLA